ncbi:MAG TPA: DNA gyrase subunit A [Chloroflexi bacterium]|nr:MAG: DNA gyrase subunit A [Chloroflexota bacterium]HDD55551.1 DNA gyrase subunit A [Chloroflexota bacterium]
MDIGSVKSINIDQEMRSSYLDYAMSVIVARALPDARDGLKPVHRRILYAMYDMGIRSNSGYKKSARIVGEVLGKYHPHGDSAVYDAMVRMAQDFSLRYPMVDGQGNFGSIDGDEPAAMRYTEARMDSISEEMLADIDKDTVDFIDNFDGSLKEPRALPARLPNLLLNGASGIAVGMATNIPPHNLKELSAGINLLIDNYNNLDKVSLDDLMKLIPGPDFPTGGTIIGDEGIRQAYVTGRGRIILRGRAHIEEMDQGGKFRIVITEIPFLLKKTTLIERIATLVREDKIKEISDLRDESDREGMNIVIELKRTAQPRKVLFQLYKYSALQTTFGVQMLALIDDEPVLLSLKQALRIYIDHRLDIIQRRTRYELNKAEARAHILDGLLIALANLDDVIETIRNSADTDTAKSTLVERFSLTVVQAQAILDMQLKRLAALERQKIEDEHKDLIQQIKGLKSLLKSQKKQLKIIKNDLAELVEKYGDDRRTDIAPDADEEINEEDLVHDQPILISITERGYIKRVKAGTYRAQKRGGIGVKGHSTRDEDEIMALIPARTLNTVLFFSDRGKVYASKAYRIPEASRTSRGLPIVNVLTIDPNEKITAIVPVADFKEAKFCTMVTKNGLIKRVDLSEFESVRPSGLISINLKEDDLLGWVQLSSGKDELIIVTRNGYALRFKEKDVRPMNRPAMGVIGIRLREGDEVIGMDIVEKGGDLLTITDKGYGKRTDLTAYPIRSRATMGVLTVDKNALDKIGHIAAARVVQTKGDLITVISAEGTVMRTRAETISQYNRVAQGVSVMQMREDDVVVSIARFADQELDIQQEEDPEK